MIHCILKGVLSCFCCLTLIIERTRYWDRKIEDCSGIIATIDSTSFLLLLILFYCLCGKKSVFYASICSYYFICVVTDKKLLNPNLK